MSGLVAAFVNQEALSFTRVVSIDLQVVRICSRSSMVSMHDGARQNPFVLVDQ